MTRKVGLSLTLPAFALLISCSGDRALTNAPGSGRKVRLADRVEPQPRWEPDRTVQAAEEGATAPFEAAQTPATPQELHSLVMGPMEVDEGTLTASANAPAASSAVRRIGRHPLPVVRMALGAAQATHAQRLEHAIADAGGTNVWAIVGFVCSFFIPLLGIIFSVIALGQIKRTGERGRGLALAGLIISIVSTLFVISLLA